MTMPSRMNCGHDDHGWCLDCVAALDDERESLQRRIEELTRSLRDVMALEHGSKLVKTNGSVIGFIECCCTTHERARDLLSPKEQP
jgi:hypothetical protein